MKTFTGTHPNRKRYRLALAGVLLLIAMPAWSVTPVEVAKLLATTGAAGDQFGGRVAIYGDTALIGGRLGDDVVKGVDSGSAYMFTDLLNGDHDGILNNLNNCPAVANPSQSDINPEGA